MKVLLLSLALFSPALLAQTAPGSPPEVDEAPMAPRPADAAPPGVSETATDSRGGAEETPGGIADTPSATNADLLLELETLRDEVELLRATAEETARQRQEARELEETRRLSLAARQDAFLTTIEEALLDLQAASESLHEGSFDAEGELEVAVERLSSWTDHPDAVTALESIQLAQAAVSSRNFLEAKTRVAFAQTVLERALRETGRRDALPPPSP